MYAFKVIIKMFQKIRERGVEIMWGRIAGSCGVVSTQEKMKIAEKSRSWSETIMDGHKLSTVKAMAHAKLQQAKHQNWFCVVNSPYL